MAEAGATGSLAPDAAARDAGGTAATNRPAPAVAGARTEVEFTAGGSLRLPAAVARKYFSADLLVALRRGDELWLYPLQGPGSGGLLLKQHNAQGDRATVIWEALGGAGPVGARPALWDERNGVMRVDLGEQTCCSATA